MQLRAQRQKDLSLAFGGQALIEGVMIRSRTHIVMCVRQPNKKIVTHSEKINSLSQRYHVFKLPFLRGIIALFETFYLGVKGIYFSANTVLEEEAQFTYKEFTLAIFLALMLSSLFFVVPFLVTTLLNLSGWLFNVVEAAVRLVIFLLYLTLVGRWSEFKRILQYHGAEHKTINAQEADVTLDVKNVSTFSRLHPRCGTSFMFLVVLVSIILFSIMPDLGFVVRLIYRWLLIPVISAISYELLKLSDRYKTSKVTKILTMPGLAFQCLMTSEPDNEMLEVAIKAVEEITKLSGIQGVEVNNETQS